MLEKDKSIELPKSFSTNSIPFAFAHTLSNHAREIAVSRSVILVTFQPGHPDHRSMTHLVSTLFPRDTRAYVCLRTRTLTVRRAQGGIAGGSCYTSGTPPVFVRNGRVTAHCALLEVHHPAQQHGRHGLLHDGLITFKQYQQGVYVS